MTFKRHNPNPPLAFECALLFLAFSVFSWGVQAKVSLYHSHAGNSPSTSSMAKLSTEEGSYRTVASVEHPDQPRLKWESLHFAAVAFVQQGNQVPPTYLSQLGPEPRVPGRFNLHGPDLMRRPPPVLS
jgi:hypothetical protein